MKTTALFLAASLLISSFAVGCAAPADDNNSELSSESDLTQTLSDSALKGKLNGILRDVTFTSESDFPYLVLEGEVAGTESLTESVVRAKLAAAVKAQSSSERDILPKSCRAEALDVNEAIAAGDAAVVPNDPNDDEFTFARHDRQVGIALKVMRSQLRSVVGFTFGTNASGDQDEHGPVLFVYVGVSKSSGKLIAIMTEAVFT